ncbi:MAG: hypothetical protein ACXVBL_19305, partial [Bdellovibrionota bacterium]
TSDLTGGGDHTFRGTTSRGLMRLLALNHLEIRNHLDTLEEELSRQLIPLFSKTPAEAVQTIRADTQSVLSDDVVRKLAASSWHDKLKNFQYNYGPVIQQLETEVAETGATQEAVKALAYLKPRSSAFSNYLQHFLANTAYSQGAIHDDFLILLNEWLRGGEDHTHPVRAQISRLLRSAAPDEVGFALVRMNSDSWILPPTEVERLELLKFLERLKRGEFSGSAWENRVLHFGAKFYRGDKNFLPVLENMLKSTPMPYARKGIEGYLAENFQGDREVFQRFGPLLLQLPASATAVQMQRAATSRLGFRLDRPERMAVTETLLSFGKLSPSAMKDFLAFYDPKDLPAADDLRLIYRLGEFHPELRARALKDILFAAESGNVSSLDIIAEFGIREPAILRAIRAFGDEGNTELAKKVRSILEFASATAACQVNFTIVAKRKR